MVYQVVCHYVGAAFGQSLVVLLGAHEVGVAFYADSLYVFVGQAACQIVQGVDGLRTQVVFVEAEQSLGGQRYGFVYKFGSGRSLGFCVAALDTTLCRFVEVRGTPALFIVVADDFLRFAAD